METLSLNLSYSEVALLLDALRHYIEYIENLDQDTIDEDKLSDLFTDGENLKNLQKQLSSAFEEKFGKY
ncbi:MAG: hypothetical protein AB1746_17385 [Candidatus Zixiibacteriota bacterium]